MADCTMNLLSRKPSNGSFLPAGPLSGANGALPWIIFERIERCSSGSSLSGEIKSIEPRNAFWLFVIRRSFSAFVLRRKHLRCGQKTGKGP